MTWHDYDPGIKEDRVVDSTVVQKYRWLAEARQAISWSTSLTHPDDDTYTVDDLTKVITNLAAFIESIPDEKLR
ncbi:hypothetical protein UFOVP273_46 [uncultured Caudovirales phage]|uniref:Uncharacterized protein n=1 Tax=uncultured Caudovirales phage TaxID=2100421 RepID=A0A6J5LN24_9CAUD|nr:hypothetical protein UFOVP273_46 [uncultured Caudovirales phage]